MSKLSYYPEATLRIPDPVVSGGRMNMDGSKKIVWHTTETPPSRFYRSNIYYHIQVRQDPTTGEVLWEQYIPFDLASRALRNDPNTPTQTNRDGDVCINVAIVGYAKDTPNLSDELLAEMAEFMVWAEKEWGVPAVFPWKFIGSEAYGIYGKARLSLSAWNHANGSLGHQHVPDGNTHWDPGVLPVDKLIELIEIVKGLDIMFADVPKNHVFHKEIEWMGENEISKGTGSDPVTGKPFYKPEGPVSRGQLAAFLYRYHQKFGGGA
jgi:hypothetical protein